MRRCITPPSTRARIALAAGALLFLTARHAAAGPDRAVAEAISVQKNECFDAAPLARSVARWLKRDRIDARIQVEIHGQPRADIELTVRRDGHIVGGRSFPPFVEPCEEVRAALGLATALAIDATVLESLGVPTPAAPPDKPSPNTASPQSPPPNPPSPSPPPPRARPGISASIDGVALFGVLPSPSPAVAPSLDLAFTSSFAMRFSGLFTGAGSLAVGSAAADFSDCHGQGDPFDHIFDMTGNVTEWENYCNGPPIDPGPPDWMQLPLCTLRGGGTGLPPDPSLQEFAQQKLSCAPQTGGLPFDSMHFERPSTGIRCCAD